jgi:polygalacturonase
MPVQTRLSRRAFLTRLGAVGVLSAASAPLYGFVWPSSQQPVVVPWASSTAAWARVDGILARIVAPVFPNRAFDITKFGAVGDGTTLCTAAISKAISACHAAGGGRVVVPAGRFLTGAIHLKSHVNLVVSEGATLAFSRDPKHYLPLVFTRWEGTELMNYSSFIYAFGQTNIAVTGTGTLDGQADETHWWQWKGPSPINPTEHARSARAKLIEMGAAGVPVAKRVFGEGSYLRPNFITTYRCQNVLFEGVSMVNSPMWEVHPVLCTNVTVRNVHINSHGPNNDGCDPESCKDVLIEGCVFDTGDDCVVLKSGRNNDGRRVNVPIENVIVRNCVMKDGHGGVVIGSEVSGGARWVFAEKCQMDSPKLWWALRIKTNAVRGGLVEHVYMRDVTVGEVTYAVATINYYYEEAENGTFMPTVRDVELRNVTSRKSTSSVELRGFAKDPIQNVRLIDCTFDNVAKPDQIEAVQGLSLTNVRVNGVLKNEVINK